MTVKCLIVCPICNHGAILDNETFITYKSIIETNLAFSENRISDADRIKQLENCFETLEQNAEVKKMKYLEESKNFILQVQAHPDEELLNIASKKRHEYNPAFLIAAEEEIRKREIRLL